jgi:beta-galactosidase
MIRIGGLPVPNDNEWTVPYLTRRELLAQAGCSAVIFSAAPYLKAMESPLAAGASSPRVTESFDFGWKFARDDASGAELPGFKDAGWSTLDLPHDWSIEGPADEHAPSGGPGGFMPTGIGWYRKKFTVPTAYRGKVVVLEFDGVYQNSDVWINGHHLGRRPYGYIPFVYELTDYLNIGGDNVVSVRVDNSKQTNCRWYSGSGIYRHTWLHVLNPVHVVQWGTFVTCPRVGADAATVEMRTTVANSHGVAAQCKLMTDIVDARGITVATLETSQTIAAGDSTCFVQQLAVPNSNLWSPANPYLYVARSTLRDPESVVDVCDTPFGIREAVFDAERGFLLNGQQIKLNGACIHNEAGSVGAAVPLRVWERRLEILKEMGCNAIRTSHNPFAAEFLDLCDRMGFLVMAEAFDEWRVPKGQIRYGYSLYFDEWHERDLINFLHRDRNHPSIVLWSAGNEIGDQSAPNGAETLRELLRIFHREDPTRPVTAACDRIASEPPSNTVKPEFLAELDIVGYNYVDRWRNRAEEYYSIDHAAFPARRVIGTESGALGGIRGDYRSLFPSDNPAEVRRFLFQQNRNIDVEQLWQFVSTYEYVAGDFMWTGIDYLGESFWPMRISPSGVLDTCGFKKDGFYFYQSQWTQKPMIHLFPHWNWEEKKAQVIPVTCYTNCDTVELFVNEKSFGVKGYEFPRMGMEGTWGNLPTRARALRTTADLHLTWDVPFEPGTLKAVGVKDGEVVTTLEIATTGPPAAIALSADRSSISADRRDVTHVTVKIQDEQGRVVPVAMNEIVFAVEGEGRLIGVDNGDPSSHEEFKANHRRAFNGLCMAIVQSTASAGSIRITAISPGLTSASLTINTITAAA